MWWRAAKTSSANRITAASGSQPDQRPTPAFGSPKSRHARNRLEATRVERLQDVGVVHAGVAVGALEAHRPADVEPEAGEQFPTDGPRPGLVVVQRQHDGAE